MIELRPSNKLEAISLVVPVYNEQESLKILVEEIHKVFANTATQWELIFIDDGSTDSSWKVISELVSQDSTFQAIRFRRNFGKAAALQAGFSRCTGDIVLTLDADLQDDPKEIPRFLEAIHQGLDVVSGWKKVRHDPWHKVFPSRVFNGMVSWLTGVKLHDHNCGFKAYRAAAVREVHLYGELHRFVPVLAAAKGFKVGELVIEHRARKFGHSKYGFRRFFKGFLDLITVRFLTAFGHRPQHLLGSLALVPFGLGCVGLLFLVFNAFLRLLTETYSAGPITQLMLFVGSITLLLLSSQMFFFGLLAELVVAKSQPAEPYSIQEILPSRRS
jgi:glycosyltransferase involved in cell wall biosynthesis